MGNVILKIVFVLLLEPTTAKEIVHHFDVKCCIKRFIKNEVKRAPEDESVLFNDKRTLNIVRFHFHVEPKSVFRSFVHTGRCSIAYNFVLLTQIF